MEDNNAKCEAPKRNLQLGTKQLNQVEKIRKLIFNIPSFRQCILNRKSKHNKSYSHDNCDNNNSKDDQNCVALKKKDKVIENSLKLQQNFINGCPFKKEITINNYSNNKSYTHSHHVNAIKRECCTNYVCKGSILKQNQLKKSQIKDKGSILDEIRDFLSQYYDSLNKKNSFEHKNRLSHLTDAYEKNEILNITTDELEFACRNAWRNSSRCIGRINWTNLKIFDMRHLKTTQEMFQALCEHLKYANNNGTLRSVITVFRQKIDNEHDYRIWNSQLINYAGYRVSETEIIGDAANIEFTKICEELGWKGKRTDFEILPWVLQANGQKPDVYDIPKELILEAKIVHQNSKKFNDLNLKWYCLPAVSSMCLDAGGIYFNCCAFNGWYMITEIARNLLESNRFNKLEAIARSLNLDMNNNASLWKDEVLLELNKAINYSFSLIGVTITDHHSAAESFVKYMENELKERGGTPADWVWINPPMSSHLTPVFGLEMINYVVRPYFEYQESPKLPKKLIKFKTLARSLSLFLYIMNVKIMKNRTKCLILFGSQTGKSEKFAEITENLFKKVFNTKLSSINNYNFDNLDKENLVLIIASSTGNGEAPTNAQKLEKIILKTNENLLTQNMFEKDLKHVRYSLLGLGSTSYADFCGFAKAIYNFLNEVNLKEIYKFTMADELNNEENSCYEWLRETFKAAVSEFRIHVRINSMELSQILSSKDLIKYKLKLRLSKICDESKTVFADRLLNLSNIFDKKVNQFELIDKINIGVQPNNTQILKVKLRKNDENILYKPGDHFEIYSKNLKEYVDYILERLNMVDETLDFDKPFLFEIFDHKLSNAKNEYWYLDKNYPIMSIRDAFTYYFDITTPLSQNALKEFALLAQNEEERNDLEVLSNEQESYNKWKNNYPNLVDTLKYFGSIKLDIAILLAELPRLKGRYYSISSTQSISKNEIDLTVGVVKYHSDFYKSYHYGVCTNYLEKMSINEIVLGSIKTSLKFHLPNDVTIPIIMVCSGTGIAPFRGFWMERFFQMKHNPNVKYGEFILFFGFRDLQKDFLYKEEIYEMVNNKVITSLYTSVSRDPLKKEKEYIQSKLAENSELLIDLLSAKSGHLYVCGRLSLSKGVKKTLSDILAKNKIEAVKFIEFMKENNKYHEDVFNT